MRKLIFALAAAGSALASTSPAAAQYYQRGYGYNYDARQNWASIQGLENRLNNAINTIGAAPYDQQYQLRRQAMYLDRQLRVAASRGASSYQIDNIANGVQRLEVELQRATAYERYRGNNGYYGDRGWHGRRDDGDRED